MDDPAASFREPTDNYAGSRLEGDRARGVSGSHSPLCNCYAARCHTEPPASGFVLHLGGEPPEPEDM